MPDPRVPCTALITFTGAVNNQKVRFLNRTNSEIISENTINTEVLVDLANLTTDVVVGDVIDVRLSGTKEFNTTITVNAQRDITASVTADSLEANQADIIL